MFASIVAPGWWGIVGGLGGVAALVALATFLNDWLKTRHERTKQTKKFIIWKALTRLNPNERASVERLLQSLYVQTMGEIVGDVPLAEVEKITLRARCRHAWRTWRKRKLLSLKQDELEPLLYEMVQEGTIEFDPTMNGFRVPVR